MREQKRREYVRQGNMRNACGDGTALCLDYINVSVLVMILHCSFKDDTARETG